MGTEGCIGGSGGLDRRGIWGPADKTLVHVMVRSI
jgi:hypothetical protein